MWLIFTLVTTMMWSLAELFYKKGARPNERYSHLKICVLVGLVMGLHAIIELASIGFDYQLINLVKYFPVSFFYILSMALSFFGMRFLAESISDPIENTSGAICSLLCVIFLKEMIGWPSAIAIGVIVIGILGVGYTERKETLEGKKPIGKKLAMIAFSMPFLYAILDAVGSFLDVFYLDDIDATPLVGVTEDNLELVANISYELTFALCALILFIFLVIKKEKMDILHQRDKAIAAVCETAGQFTYVYAMSGNGAIAAPIISSVCVFSVILSRIFLKEKLSKYQYLFIGLVIAGILALAIIEGE